MHRGALDLMLTMGFGPAGGEAWQAGGSGEEGLGLGAADMETGCGPHRDIEARQGAVNALGALTPSM